jgi:hypothetical protein
MLHRAADRPARPEVPRRATGLARRRRLVRLLLSGWDCDQSRLRFANPCLSGWGGWRLRFGLALRLPRRSAQASPLQSAANRLRGRRLSRLASGGRPSGGGPSNASGGDGDRRLDPSVVPVRGLRADRSPARHCRRGGLASRCWPRRWPRLGARHVIRWIDRPSGVLSPPGNRKRNPRQSSEPERADSQPGEPETGESADRDRGLAEAARPIVVIRHEDGSLGLRTRRRNPCRCLSLDRRGCHSDTLLSRTQNDARSTRRSGSKTAGFAELLHSLRLIQRSQPRKPSSDLALDSRGARGIRSERDHRCAHRDRR